MAATPEAVAKLIERIEKLEQFAIQSVGVGTRVQELEKLGLQTQNVGKDVETRLQALESQSRKFEKKGITEQKSFQALKVYDGVFSGYER